MDYVMLDGGDCPNCIQKGNLIHLCAKCKEEQTQHDRELVQALTGPGWISLFGDEVIVGITPNDKAQFSSEAR